jgi:hypothetical protein
LDRLDHSLLGRFGAALGFAGALLRLGDAVANLLQAPLALVLFGLELGQTLGLRGAALRLLGALFDLPQAILRLGHRLLLRFTVLLEALLGSLEPPRSGGERRNRRHALGHLARLRLGGAPFGFVLQPLRFLNPAVGLGADPLLLALYLGHLVVNPLFGHGRVLVSNRGTRHRRAHWRGGQWGRWGRGSWRLGQGGHRPRRRLLSQWRLRRRRRHGWQPNCALLQLLPLLGGARLGQLALGLCRFLASLSAARASAAGDRLAAAFGPFGDAFLLAPFRLFLAPFAMLEASRSLLLTSLLALVLGTQRLTASGWW